MHEVIETFSASKTGVEADNEDGYLITDTMVAIFDGATDKRISQTDHRPGLLATKALLEAVHQIPGNATPKQIVADLHLAIKAVAQDLGNNDSDGCVAAGAIAHIPSKFVVRVGDISVGLDGTFDIPHKIVDLIAGDARAEKIRERLSAGATQEELLECDPGREFVLDWLRGARIVRNRSNTRLGFAVLDGTSTPDDMTDKFDLAGVGELVLATDGYLSPRSTLEESEKVLKETNARDPLRIEDPPGTKGIAPSNISFDDRAYVRVRLN